MNVDFSDEQQELRRQAQRLLGTGPRAARVQLESDAPFDRALWRQAVEMGWTAAAIAEEQGGLGLGTLELCVLAEECGRVLAPLPFAASVLQATEALRLAQFDDSDEVANEWLPRLAAGEVVATVALVERGSRLWTDKPAARVSGGRLTGTKAPVAHAAGADIAVVSAHAADDGDGFSLWLVDLRGEGVQRGTLKSLDLVNRHGLLRFEGAAARRVGAPGSGAAILQRLTETVAVLTAFEQLGSAQGAMALTLDYVKTRKAFGREVAGYQAVKHKLADMYVKVQLARSHAYYGAWALSQAASELPQAAAGARLAALDALAYVTEESVELHGGIGFTWECDIQLYYRNCRAQALGLGGRQYWSRALTAALVASLAEVATS
jgi:acyl-CoA dehydrogenase